MACEGCGERIDRCRCDGTPWDEDMAFGFHITTEAYEAETNEEYDDEQ